MREKNQQAHTHTNVSNRRHGGDYSTSDQASNCRKYDCFYDYCDYFCFVCLFVLFPFFLFWLLMLNSFTSNEDCVCLCGGVCTCLSVSVLFVRLCSSFLWWLLYFYALNNLVIFTYILNKWTNRIRAMWSVKSTC